MTEYAIDPEIVPWLEVLPSHPLRTYEDLLAARPRISEIRARMPVYEPSQPIDVRDELIPGAAGEPDVRVRIYAPPNTRGTRPGLVYIHGGGFVAGDVDMSDSACLKYADVLGIVVLSVDYRLAPETPFPGPVEDCYAALVWTAAKATELGIDPVRIGVAGGSAGGGLAAGTVLLARDRGGPAVVFQHLGVPELDDRLETESMRTYVDTPMWSRPSAVFSWDSYLGEGKRGTAGVSPYAAPARAADLSGLPSTVVMVCQFDPLRDEGIEYARRLSQANVPTELRGYPGTFHGSGMVTDASVSKRMAVDELEDLRRGLRITSI
ncbi:alpha/beta hydrolase fold domain-containing protein [Kibdelosporangium philippinense]|uniref:Alpha/beta hydrolase fold domain-containing protein n=1 Tax=Kibdelosporangium philippinense TaxID=211113 RepID=A0ABS8Z186_9PSEU|nr:alpha/beta hydrolase [Kibdelosporangium philippinense]MCE7001701.1 alpha/beta hydrolase fold domain-containing protein [Kibdelosporangium philippinense]